MVSLSKIQNAIDMVLIIIYIVKKPFLYTLFIGCIAYYFLLRHFSRLDYSKKSKIVLERI